MSQTKVEELLAAECELQHYSFTTGDLKESCKMKFVKFWRPNLSFSLLFVVRDLLDQKISEVTDAMITTIINKSPEPAVIADKLRECRDTLAKDIAQDCRTNLPEIDRLFVDVFSVPPHVLLHDETEKLAYRLSDHELEKLQNECAEYEKSCQTNKVLIAQMNEELTAYRELKASGFFDKTATTIEVADEALGAPIDVDRLTEALDKIKQMNS
jgi:hypothetical protein